VTLIEAIYRGSTYASFNSCICKLSGFYRCALSINAEQPAKTTVAAPVPRTRTCGESFSHNSTEEFNKKCVALAGQLAAMRGENLILRIDNGTRKIFSNKDGAAAVEAGYGYGLSDFYPSTHIFVVATLAQTARASLLLMDERAAN
jgi:hypothetical protein